MSGKTFFCPYCKRKLPGYFVPHGHGRVAVICFECHIEQQDIWPRKDNDGRGNAGWDPVRKILTEEMYQAWKLVEVHGLSHEQAGKILGISQQSVSARLKRAVKRAIRLRGSIARRGRYAS